MQTGIAAMTVALRVLTAVTERREPAVKDLEELRRLAPLLADQPIDELACDVIQQASRQRAELRKSANAA